MKNPFQEYNKQFSENLFWIKVKKMVRSAGVKVVYSALLLFYTYRRRETPKWAKKVIIGALGYFISPIDAIPDLTPFLGYTDDLSVLAFALSTLAFFINNEVSSSSYGSCIFTNDASFDIINSTFTNNVGGHPAYGVITNINGSTNLFNNIIHGNNGYPATATFMSSVNAENNLVDIPGIIAVGSNGNFVGDPSFVNAGSGDYNLQDTSLAVNAGDQLLLPIDSCDIDNDLNITEIIQWDLNGASRVHLCAVDLGAFENQQMEICDPSDSDVDGIVDNIDLCPDNKDTSLEFDGIDDHIAIPHDAALNVGGGDFTFQAWVNPTTNDPSTVVSKGAGVSTNYVLEISSASNVSFYFAQSWHYGTITLPLNQWSHVAVSFDQATQEATFYVNGVVDIVASYINVPDTSDTNPLTIGRQGHGTGVNLFEGRIDDVAIWNVAKSQAEINSYMSYPLSGNEPGMVAHYNMNDGFACGDNSANTTATDNSPNAFHGTLTNYDLSTNCGAGWSSGRNLDSDGDSIGDACDSEPCPPSLTLTGNQLSSATYETDGEIVTSQQISSPANVEYNSATSVEFVAPFEIQLGATLITKNDGCD